MRSGDAKESHECRRTRNLDPTKHSSMQCLNSKSGMESAYTKPCILRMTHWTPFVRRSERSAQIMFSLKLLAAWSLVVVFVSPSALPAFHRHGWRWCRTFEDLQNSPSKQDERHRACIYLHILKPGWNLESLEKVQNQLEFYGCHAS